MDGALTPWLEESVTTDLLLGVNWLEERIQAKLEGVKRETGAGLYQDNGSCLDVNNDIEPGNSCRLQIIKLSPLTLSDGHTHIEALLTPACDRRLAPQYNGSRLCDDHLYKFMTIRAYTLRSTPYGPPTNKLCLVLRTIESQPDSHTAVIGRPTPLLLRLEVGILLEKLARVRAQGDRGYGSLGWKDNLDTMSPTASLHASNDEGSNNTTHDSQSLFGTQLPPPVYRGVHRGSVGRGGASSFHNPQPVMLANRNIGTMEMNTERHNRASRGAQYPKNSSRSPQTPRKALVNLINKIKPTDVSAPQSPPSAVSPKEVVGKPSPPSRKETANHAVSPKRNRSASGVAQERLARYEPQTARQNPAHQDHVTSAQEVHGLEESTEADIFVSGAEWMSDWKYNARSAKATQEQQVLLVRTDHWAKPPVGHQYPVGSIPRVIQDDIEANIEAQLRLITSNHSASAEDAEDVEEMALEPDSDGSSDSVPGEEPTTSQVSWENSPTPEPLRPDRFNHALPPDSSFPTIPPVPEAAAPPKSFASHPASIADDDMADTPGEVNPPSSPPPMLRNDADDEDGMELDIPQGLGEDQVATPHREGFNTADVYVSISSAAVTKPTILVEKTPYGKGNARQSTNPPSATHHQTSSGTSKSGSSTSIVYGTFNEPVSSERAQPEQDTAAQPNNVPMMDAISNTTPRQLSLPPMEYEANHDRVTAMEPNEAVGDTDQRPSPATPQMPLALERKQLQQPPLKRKSNVSPSKINRRLPKRREIKIVGFGGSSPLSQDPEAEFKQHRRESMQKLREGYTPDLPRATPTHQLHLKQMDVDPVQSGKAVDAGHEHLPDSLPLYNRSTPPSRLQPVVQPPDPRPRYIQGNVQTQLAHIAQSSPGAPGVFEKFKAAYPEYTAGVKHFLGLCKQMIDLESDDKMVPKWQWDDYIIRNRTDYMTYAMDCLDAGEEPVQYHRFYKDQVRDTIHKKGIILNVAILLRAIDEVDGTPATVGPPRRDRTTARARSSLSWGHGQATAGSQATELTQGRDLLGNLPPKVKKSPAITRASTIPNREIPLLRPLVSVPKAKDCSPTANLTHGKSHSPASGRSDGHSIGISEGAIESNGNVFRDYVIAQQRMTSWTGSTRVDDQNSQWPKTLLVRPSVAEAVAHRPSTDVLSWNDTL